MPVSGGLHCIDKPLNCGTFNRLCQRLPTPRCSCQGVVAPTSGQPNPDIPSRQAFMAAPEAECHQVEAQGHAVTPNLPEPTYDPTTKSNSMNQASCQVHACISVANISPDEPYQVE